MARIVERPGVGEKRTAAHPRGDAAGRHRDRYTRQPDSNTEESIILAAPLHGFVFLAMPKCASTSIEAAFRSYAQVVITGPPSYKHLDYSQFARHVAPLLADRGHPRDSYEVVCLFRDPIDWLVSWWKYRSRPQLGRATHPNHAQYAGDLSFADFATAYMSNAAPARFRRPSDFVKDDNGNIAVDRIYRMEDLDLLVRFLSERVGRDVDLADAGETLPRKKISPPREADIPEALRDRLEQHMAAEIDIYRHGTVGSTPSPTPKTR